MRTTVTLDPDVEASCGPSCRITERGVSFKVAINDAIRTGLRTPAVAARPTAGGADGGGAPLDLASRGGRRCLTDSGSRCTPSRQLAETRQTRHVTATTTTLDGQT